MTDKTVFELSEREIILRKKEMLTRIARDMELGMSTKDALEAYKDIYIEYTGTVLTQTAVAESFKNHGDKEKYEKYKKEMERKARDMANKGATVISIAKELGISKTTARTLLRKTGPKQEKKKEVDTFVLTNDMVERFRDSLKVGDSLQCRVSRANLNNFGLLVTNSYDENVVITSKYKHFCETNKGTFRWADLYLFRRARAMA